MKMKRLLGCILTIVILIVSLCSITVSALAYALDNEVMTTLNTYSAGACEKIGVNEFELVIPTSGTSKDDAGVNDEKVYVVFNQDSYDVLSVVQKKEYIDYIVGNCKSADCTLNAAQRQQAYNFLVSVDDSYINAAVADMLNTGNSNLLYAITKMGPVFSYINTGFGFLVVIILIITTAVTVVDICYMSLPIFQTLGKDDKKPKFISNEAYKALQIHIDTGANVYGTYFKKRVASILIIFCCLAIILTGRLGDFITFIVSLFM